MKVSHIINIERHNKKENTFPYINLFLIMKTLLNVNIPSPWSVLNHKPTWPGEVGGRGEGAR